MSIKTLVASAIFTLIGTGAVSAMDCHGFSFVLDKTPTMTQAVMLCEAAENVQEFFQEVGVEVPDLTVRVDFDSMVPLMYGAFALALLDHSVPTIVLVPVDMLKDSNGLWGLDLNDAGVRRSVLLSQITHELAHVVVQAVSPVVVYRAGHEYIAYTAQITTMDPAVREQVLQFDTTVGVLNRDTLINDMIHFYDPHGFGAESYRNYKSREDGPEFVRAILTGKFNGNDASGLSSGF